MVFSWFLSLSNKHYVSSKSCHNNNSFFSMLNNPLLGYATLLTHWLIKRHLYCFQVLSIINKNIINVQVQIFFCMYNSCELLCITSNEHNCWSMFSFLETIHFSFWLSWILVTLTCKATKPFGIPTINEWQSLLNHPHQHSSIACVLTLAILIGVTCD